MFTGLIQDVGAVEAVTRRDEFAILRVSSELVDETLKPGDSLAVNGACLTAVKVRVGSVNLEAVSETLNRTNLGMLQSGNKVNLERPLRLGDRLDGHWVLGHVDTVVAVHSIKEIGPSRIIRLNTAEKWLRYIVEKGSVALDGVSLTVASVDETGFSVSLIPHTLKRCTIGEKKIGDGLNLETDILAKHLEKYVSSFSSIKRGDSGGKGLDEALLRKYGFS